MDNINILFVNRSNDNDVSIRDREAILSRIKKPLYQTQPKYKITLQEVVSIDDAKKKLQKGEYDVLIMWVNRENSNDWDKLDKFLEQEEKLYYLGFIVLFNFRETNIWCCTETKVLKIATQTLSRRIFSFFYPINCDVLEASIKALASYEKYHKSLADLKENLANAKDLNSIVEKALKELRHHPLVGYDRATITLVDHKTENLKRYLLNFNDEFEKSYPLPNRNLQKDILGNKIFRNFWCKCYLAIPSSLLIKAGYFNFWFLTLISSKAGDKLIKRVHEKTVLIIDNLDEIRKEDEETKQQLFKVFGWDDTPPTDEINSWIGLAAKRPNKKIVAILTLETLKHKKTPKYKEKDYKLRDFLEDFGEIFADAVEDFSLKRNARIIKKIINEVGNNLQAKELVKNILKILQQELRCDNCNYFLVKYDINQEADLGNKENKVFLDQWNLEKDSDSNKTHIFKKGEGIVGAVLTDGKSRIVPNASEDKEFFPTHDHPGHNFSMLAVPVVPIYDDSNQPNRIIGVICCNKKGKTDHFTVYDRDLVEEVAFSTADVIERTRILELSNDISKRMAEEFIHNPIKTELLRDICHHALNVTNANTASIHLLEQLDYSKGVIFAVSIFIQRGLHRLVSILLQKRYRSVEFPYYTYPVGEEEEPRLNGNSTTDKVIEELKTIEFSKKEGDFKLIAPDQIKRGVKCKLVVPLIITENSQKRLIGALYLCKYSEDRFSEVEKFALELFANQAASIIYDQRKLYENKFSADAYKKLQEASERITSTNINLQFLKLIAQYSYELVEENLNYQYQEIKSQHHKNKLSSTSKYSEHESKLDLPVLVSYVLFLDEGEYRVKAAWPEYELTPLMKKYDYETKRKNVKQGIAGVAREKRKSILVQDIEEDTEERREYIEFYKTTRTQLSVPILYNRDNNNPENKEVIGVINLEYSQPYIFQEFHQNVIELFAKQIAIAYQKKELIDSTKDNNKILKSLHKSLNKITQKSPKNMLYEAVAQTRESFSAKRVIVIPIKKSKIVNKEIVPGYENWMEVLYSKSKKVYEEDKEKVFSDKDLNNSQKKKFEKSDSRSGLCIPFSSGEEKKDKIGVMWILFSKSIDTDDTEQIKNNKDTYRIYANQIALAYANSKQFEELKNKDSKSLSKTIDLNRNFVLYQAIIWFVVSVISSLIGLHLIFSSFDTQKTVKQEPGVTEKTVKQEPGITDVNNSADFNQLTVGLLLQGVTILTINQGITANNRMDKYYDKLDDTNKFYTILSATEELDPEIMKKEKQSIIDTTTNHWLKPSNEVSKNNEIKESKSTDN